MVATRSSHSRMPIAPPQQHLQQTKKIVHRRVSPRARQKWQSTLTQLDYVRTPQSSRCEIEIISSDDDELREVQPRKKRKTSDTSKSKAQRYQDQSTLTQKWTTPILSIGPSFEIEDSEEEDVLEVKAREHDQLGYCAGVSNTAKDHLGDVIEHSDCHAMDSEASTRSFRHAHFMPSSNDEEQVTRPTTADTNSHALMRTPIKSRRTEIPSSVSPQSIHACAKPGQSSALCAMSPLGERSVNIPSSHRSQYSKATKPGSSKIDDEEGPSMTNAESVDIVVKSPLFWTAILTVTPKKDPARSMRTLKRTATVQDSEDEDIELNDSPLPLKSMDIHMGQENNRSEVRQPGSPKWKRSGVVPDSEEAYEDFSQLLIHGLTTQKPSQPGLSDVQRPAANTLRPCKAEGLEKAVEHNIGDATYSNNHNYANNDKMYTATQFPQTYDPVVAALARDAERFGKTETQLEREDWRCLEVEENSTRPDAVTDPAGQMRDLIVETDRVPSSQSVEACMPSSTALNDTMRSATAAKADDVDDSGYCSQLSMNAVVTIPSSQPSELSACSMDHCAESGIASTQSKAATKVEGEVDGSIAVPASSFDAPSQSIPKQCVGQDPKEDSKTWVQQLRPSQISTVCDVQSQLQLESSQPLSPSDQLIEMPSPTKATITWHETVPSSPFPMPPELAARRSWLFESQAGSLADFSLPPPPPMFSSTRQSSGESEL